MTERPPTEDLSRDVLLRAAPRDANGRPVLGQVPLQRLLGKGRMGAVYYGVHPGLQAEVAVRVLPFHIMQTPPDVVEHFMSRTRAAAQVSSPYLVRVLNINCEHGIHYMVSEYIKGTSVKALVGARQAEGTRGLDETQALSIMLAVCQGLREAHRQGLTHGDIKPHNVLIPETADGLQLGQAKLADLGISKPADPKATLKTEAVLGTPGYMAPEQAMDANAAVPGSDVFSVGCTLYAMLTGRPPFVAPTMTAMLVKTVSDPHTPLSKARTGVSRQVDALVDRCLAKSASDRPADGTALLGEMLRVHQGKMPTGKPGTGRRTTKGVRPVRGERGTQGLRPTGPKPNGEEVEQKSKVPLIAGLAVLVVLSGLIVGLVFSGSDEEEQSRLAAGGTNQVETVAPAGQQDQPAGVSRVQSPEQGETLTEERMQVPDLPEIDMSSVTDPVAVDDTAEEREQAPNPDEEQGEAQWVEDHTAGHQETAEREAPSNEGAGPETTDHQPPPPPPTPVEEPEPPVDAPQVMADLRQSLIDKQAGVGSKLGVMKLLAMDEEGLTLEMRTADGAISMHKSWDLVTPTEYARMVMHAGMDDSATHLGLALVYESKGETYMCKQHLKEIFDPAYREAKEYVLDAIRNGNSKALFQD